MMKDPRFDSQRRRRSAGGAGPSCVVKPSGYAVYITHLHPGPKAKETWRDTSIGLYVTAMVFKYAQGIFTFTIV